MRNVLLRYTILKCLRRFEQNGIVSFEKRLFSVGFAHSKKETGADSDDLPPFASASDSVVLEQTHGDVALVGINRPKVRNCVNPATALALRESLERFDRDDGLRTAILHGIGGNFCAGYDLKELSDGDYKDQFFDKLASDPLFRPMGPTKLFLSKPLIGAISGYAVAGGLELALLCDVRIIEENVVFGVFCRRFGVPLIDGGTVRLSAIVGYGRAMEMILTGRAVSAREALQWGLASSVVSTGTAVGCALSFARSLSKFPRECMLADRRSLFHATFEAPSVEAALDYEFINGLPVVEREAIKGARRFADEKVGRGASFDLDGMKRRKNNS